MPDIQKQLLNPAQILLDEARGRMSGFVFLTSPQDYIFGWLHYEICNAITQFVKDVENKKSPRLMVLVPPRHGKLISDDTPVLTIDGWKIHGDIKPGDYVFGVNGKPIKVIAESSGGFANREISFENGEKIKCHENHEWTVWQKKKRSWSTIETNNLEKSHLKYKENGKNRSTFGLPFIDAIQFNMSEHIIDPYVLGAWLGDGTSGKPSITYSPKDFHVVDEVKKFYPISVIHVHKTTGCLTASFATDGWKGHPCKMKKDLMEISVFNNKHIPDSYKYSHISSRLRLLAGLIDTDGHVDKKSRVRIVTASKILAEDIKDLVGTFGWHCYIEKANPVKSTSGIVGKKIVYTVGFNPKCDIPTLIPRKKIKRFPVNRKIGIKSISKIKDVTGKCIQVDSPDGLYLIGKSLIPTHNSTIVSERLPGFFLGRNPDKSIIAAAHTQGLANKFSRSARSIIAGDDYKEIFQGTRLDPDRSAVEEWMTDKGGYYKAAGVGTGITGLGGNILSIDDPIRDGQEAASETIRESIWDWYISTAFTRLAPGGGVVITVTRWHEDDLAGRLLKTQPGKWKVLSFPAIAEEDEKYRKKGEALHPARYSLEALLEIKQTTLGYYWSALFQQSPTYGDSAYFKRDNFKYFHAIPDGWEFNGQTIRRLDTGEWEGLIAVYQTVDPAGTDKQDSSYFVCMTFGITKTYDILVLDVWREHADTTRHHEIILQQFKKWRPYRVCVEKKIFGINIIQDFTKEGLPIVPLIADRSKELRSENIRVDYENGKVYHLSGASWLADFEMELLQFPTGKHSDQVDTISYAGILKQKVWLERQEKPREREIKL